VTDDPFDPFDPEASKAGKIDGMTRVDEGADPSWSARMQAYAVETARALPFFTSDDVYRRALAAGMTMSTHDQRAFGPVMLRVAKAGVCRKADLPPVNSQRKTLHASPRSVWRSLIYVPRKNA